MNERILELAKQSGAATILFNKEGHYYIIKPELQKFAELIVQECLTFVEPMPGSGDIDDLALEAAYNQIKEHFGV